jgi:hypothetical protein
VPGTIAVVSVEDGSDMVVDVFVVELAALLVVGFVAVVVGALLLV